MTSLWADGWFYISAVGFAVSCLLFVYLLGQYRAALEAEEEAQEESPEEAPALVLDERHAPVVPLVNIEKPAAAAESITHLKDIKSHVELLEKEISALKSWAQKQSAQGENVLERLSEIAEKMEKAKKVAPASTPVAVVVAEEPEPKPQPKKSPAPVVVSEPASQPQPEAQAEEPAAAAPKQPVWPV